MIAAGQQSLAEMAWSGALDWFRQAAERRPDGGEERIEALIGIGTAERALGRRDDARRALTEALDLARAGDAPRLAAEATLALVGGGARGVAEDVDDAERADLLRTAIAGLGADDDDLVIPAQLELALALLLTDRVDERTALASDALQRARRLGRPDLLGNALLGSRVARPSPEHAEERLADVAEVLAIDAADRPLTVTLAALMSRHEDALLIGDRALATAALDDASVLADAAGHPYWRWVVATWHTLGLIIDGDLDGAEAASFAALELQADHPEAIACLGVELVDVRLYQGRSGEMVDLLSGAADENPQIPCYRAVLALCLAESGDRVRAEIEYRSFADHDFATIPDDTNRLLTLAVLADVAATLGDEIGGRSLARLLTPHAERQVILNCFGGGGAYWGPVATQLGRLAALAGNDAASEHWFEQALQSAIDFGAPLAADAARR
jgi:tetratricopeptide (TPR) repeat protein